MTTVLHTQPYCRFIGIQSNLRRKRLQEQTKVPIFLKAVLVIEIMQESQSSLEEKVNPSILKYEFSSRTDPSILTSMAQVLLD